MSYHNSYRRILAMALSIVVTLGILPVSAVAEEAPIGASDEIISFEALPEETAKQTVPLGTSLEKLDLPEALTATMLVAAAADAEGQAEQEASDKPVPDSGEAAQNSDESTDSEDDRQTSSGDNTVEATTGSAVTSEENGAGDTPEVTQTDVSVPITWVSAPDYDGNAAGVYTFTPEIESFSLADGVRLPQITVTVGIAPDEITAFAALSEDVRWQSVEYGTALENLNLPKTLSGEVEGTQAEIPVTWEAEPGYDGQAKRLYLFTAVPGEGFTADAEPPVIAVVVRGEAPRFAAFARGGGAVNTDPFLIDSAAQLAAIAEIVNEGRLEALFLGAGSSGQVYLKLENDIDLSGYTDNGGWVPIGNSTNQFMGSFDGGGNKITGLTINRSTTNYQGLFGYLLNGTVKNLGVANVSITGYGYVSGVAGQVNLSTVQNCYTSGSINGAAYVGGVAGYAYVSSLQSCYSTAGVTGTNLNIGGVAGNVDQGTMQDCAALNPFVSGFNSNIGRVAGRIDTVRNVSGNIAFVGMTVTVNGVRQTITGDEGNGNNGADRSIAQLQSLSGFPEALTAAPWIYEPGMLPGLGAAVDMPLHLLGDTPFEGDGSDGNPYKITTAAQLARLAELVNAGASPYANAGVCYRLENSLDLSGYTGSGGWTPIGGADPNPFKGSFNGGGNQITGLYINRSSADSQGLFGRISSGSTVENLGIVGADILGRDDIGGVAGSVSGTVRNCYVTGSVSGRNNVGGVVGAVLNGAVQSCYTTAGVFGTQSGSGRAGGVAGLVNYGSLTDCAALNPTVGGGYYAGRVAGDSISGGALSGNIAFDGMTVNGDTSNAHDGVPKTADDIRTGTGLPSALKTAPWTQPSGRLPGLNGQTVDLPAHLLGNTPFLGGGSDGNPYQITTAAQLARLAQLVNADNTTYNATGVWYQLMNNLDLSGYASDEGWVPIGNDVNPFKGSFDGNHQIITGLTINRSTMSQGLFGKTVTGSLVQNLGLESVNIRGGHYTGGVAGIVEGTVQSCYSTGSVSGAEHTGGVAGHISSGRVENCYSACSVRGANYTGGVVGLASGMVKNCYSTGSVSGTSNVGGVAGFVPSRAENCAALNPSVSASANNSVGRVAGDTTGSNLQNNFAYGGMTVTGSGGTKTITASATGVDGESRDKTALQAAGGFPCISDAGDIFSADPWTYIAGKLPGLGAAADMPLHLFSSSTTGLEVFLSGDGIGGSAPTYSTKTSLTDRTVTVTITGWEGWTNKEVTVTVKKPDNSPLAVTPQNTTDGNATFTLPGITEGTFIVTAAAKSNPVNVKTTVYLEVSTEVISSASVTGIVAPAAGAEPIARASLTAGGAQFSVTGLTWQNSNGSAATLTPGGKFKAGSDYKAVIELTAASGYKFFPAGLTPAVDTGSAAHGTASGNIVGNKLTFPVTFPATAAKTVTNIAVKTQPARLTYTAGEALDLSGLAATLTYNDSSTEDVAPAGFSGKGITASPADTTPLSIASHNGHSVTLRCNTHTAVTDTLTVNPAPIGAASVAMTAPAAGAAPQTAAQAESATGNSGYVVSGLVWNEALTTAGKFKAGQVYTATVTLTSQNEKTFQAAAFAPAVAGADEVGPTTTSGTGTGNTVSFTVTFPATAAKTVTGIAVKTQPAKLIYTAGEALDLSGLSATLTYNDGSAEDVVLAGFGGKGIVASPADATALTTGNSKVTITHTASGKSAEQLIAVNPASVTNKTLVSVTAPQAITGLANSTAKTASALGLPGIVTLVTSDGNVSAGVMWDVASSSYNPSNTNAQNFTVNGIVTLPAGVINPDGVPLTVSISVTVNARTNDGGNNDGGSDGGSDSGRSNTTITIQPDKMPDQPVIAGFSITGTVDKNGHATISISKNDVDAAIKKALADAKAQGKTANGIGMSINLSLPDTAKSLGIVLPRTVLKSLIDAGTKQFEIGGVIVSLNFDKKALDELYSQSTGDITITIRPAQKLSETAKKVIGTRPVYDVTVSYVKDGKTVNITSLGSGSVTLSLPYTPGKNETAGYLYGVYVDGSGKASRISGSAYDANSGRLILGSNHFSVYGVGYSTPTEKYTDIAGHWAKESIDYAVGRGLFSGTTDTKFSPDTAMNRGMLVTVLGRLAGADVSRYKTSSFTDVAADKYYLPYVEWAYQKGIVSGTGNGRFEPERAVIREEIALILQNYAKATGYTLPVTREGAAYADASSIGSAYTDAVKAMQQAGIVMGGNGNKFNPKSSATRAEVSAMLHRYIKLTIDHATAQGWAQGDAGQYLYYKDGKILTGTQTIDDVKYFFETTGVLKTGWVREGDNWRYYSGNTMLVGFWDLGADGSNKTCYFTKDGIMIAGKWLQIDGKWYYFYPDGSLARSIVIDGYEVDENGVRKKK